MKRDAKAEMVELARPQASPSPTLEVEIRRVLNKASAENGSDTPDFILSGYLMACLQAFDVAVGKRNEWYGGSKEDASGPVRVDEVRTLPETTVEVLGVFGPADLDSQGRPKKGPIMKPLSSGEIEALQAAWARAVDLVLEKDARQGTDIGDGVIVYECPVCDGQGEVEGAIFDSAGRDALTIAAHGIGDGLKDAQLLVSSIGRMVATLSELEARAEKAEANYQFMVDRAVNEKLDGYRELAAKVVAAEEARDAAREKTRTIGIQLVQESATGAMLKEEIEKARAFMLDLLHAFDPAFRTGMGGGLHSEMSQNALRNARKFLEETK